MPYYIGWILSKFFIEKAFSEEAKTFGDQIVSDIKVQFIKKLQSTDWMSNSVRQKAIAKGHETQCNPHQWRLADFGGVVHNIVQKIGYPVSSPDVRNPVKLQEYYETVNITSTEYFSNSISIAQFDASREWSALGKPTDRDEWGMSVPTVNVRFLPYDSGNW